MAKLLTSHDPNHIHAVCGLLALLHHIYRFRLLVLDVPFSGFGQNWRHDLVCMAIMALPNATSFLFNIVPAKKGLDGFTIWKEYRLHALIFGLKLWLLLGTLLFGLYAYPTQRGLKYEAYYRAFFEFATMYGLQYATSLYPPQVSTIRGMYKGSPVMVFVAGYLQFTGRAAILCGTPHPSDDISMCYIAILVVQLNAFNMTLRKKRIIGPIITKTFYTIMLGSSLYLLFLRRLRDYPPTGPSDRMFKPMYLASIAYFCRRQGMDRFASWIVAMSAMTVATQFGLCQDEGGFESLMA